MARQSKVPGDVCEVHMTALQILSHKCSSAWAFVCCRHCEKTYVYTFVLAIFAGKDVAPYSSRLAVRVIKNK